MKFNPPNNGQRVSPQDFLYLNFAIALVLGLLFFRGRKQRPPSRLKLSGNSSHKRSTETSIVEATREEIIESGPKSLNTMFNYNGHTWDAYEVLGAPAGSSLSAVEKCFHEALKCSRKESEGFLRAAYEAIVADQKPKR